MFTPGSVSPVYSVILLRHGESVGNAAFATLTYQPNEHKWTVHGVNDLQHWKGRSE